MQWHCYVQIMLIGLLLGIAFSSRLVFRFFVSCFFFVSYFSFIPFRFECSGLAAISLYQSYVVRSRLFCFCWFRFVFYLILRLRFLVFRSAFYLYFLFFFFRCEKYSFLIPNFSPHDSLFLGISCLVFVIHCFIVATATAPSERVNEKRMMTALAGEWEWQWQKGVLCMWLENIICQNPN